jgi:hypothetical protein
VHGSRTGGDLTPHRGGARRPSGAARCSYRLDRSARERDAGQATPIDEHLDPKEHTMSRSAKTGRVHDQRQQTPNVPEVSRATPTGGLTRSVVQFLLTPLVAMRSGRYFVAALTCVLAMLALPTTAAHADATSRKLPVSVHVYGQGLFVSTVKAQLTLAPGQNMTGHFQIWGPGFNFDGPEKTYTSGALDLIRIRPVPLKSFYMTRNVFRDLPNDSWVCAQFHKRVAVNRHVPVSTGGIPCVKIKRGWF